MVGIVIGRSGELGVLNCSAAFVHPLGDFHGVHVTGVARSWHDVGSVWEG